MTTDIFFASHHHQIYLALYKINEISFLYKMQTVCIVEAVTCALSISHILIKKYVGLFLQKIGQMQNKGCEIYIMSV